MISLQNFRTVIQKNQYYWNSMLKLNGQIGCQAKLLKTNSLMFNGQAIKR